jgi:hypothetical protein
MREVIHAQMGTIGLATLLATFAMAQSTVTPPTSHDVATVGGYWRLLAAEGDHLYVAQQGQCPKDLSLPTGNLRPLAAKCPAGETWQLVVGAKNFYWAQSSAAGARSRKSPRELFACLRQHCVPHRIEIDHAYSLDTLLWWNGGVLASLSQWISAVKGVAPSILVAVDDESGKVQLLAKNASRIVSFNVDAKDVYYYADDSSNVIWRKSLMGKGQPESLVRNANNSQLLSARSLEEALEIDRSSAQGHPPIHDFERIVDVDEERVYWQTRLLHWHAKAGPAIGLFTDNGRPLSVFGRVISDGQHLYFTNSNLTLIQSVSKRTGRSNTLVTGQAGVASFLVAQRRLIWSTYSQARDTTSIHWIEIPAGE